MLYVRVLLHLFDKIYVHAISFWNNFNRNLVFRFNKINYIYIFSLQIYVCIYIYYNNINNNTFISTISNVGNKCIIINNYYYKSIL